jgi:hypothetical protein
MPAIHTVSHGRVDGQVVRPVALVKIANSSAVTVGY